MKMRIRAVKNFLCFSRDILFYCQRIILNIILFLSTNLIISERFLILLVLILKIFRIFGSSAVLIYDRYSLNLSAIDGSDDYFDCGNDESLNITGSLTIEAWIKLDATGNNQDIVSKWNNAAGERGFVLWYNGSIIEFAKRNPDDSTIDKIDGITIINADLWYHIVGVFDDSANTLDLYINGKSDATQVSGTDGILSSSRNVLIGSQYISGSPTYYFNGLIDEVRIYNRTLSADEIKQHYYNRKDIIIAEKNSTSVLVISPQHARNQQVRVKLWKEGSVEGNWSGNLEVTGNLTVASKITFALGAVSYTHLTLPTN